MLGFIIILGLSFILTLLDTVIKGMRGDWHMSYVRVARFNIVFTLMFLAIYGAYLLGHSQ